MNVTDIAQLSTTLSTQRTSAQLNVSGAKLSNDSIKASGEAALKLIQSVPQPQGNVGNNLNVKV